VPAADFLSCAVLTRPDDSNRALASMLQARGVQVLQAPALEISRIPGVVGAGQSPACYDMVVFVSGNAVRAYLLALAEAGLRDGLRPPSPQRWAPLRVKYCATAAGSLTI
jgi:uroporphyrinogen-III synthase